MVTPAVRREAVAQVRVAGQRTAGVFDTRGRSDIHALSQQ